MNDNETRVVMKPELKWYKPVYQLVLVLSELVVRVSRLEYAVSLLDPGFLARARQLDIGDCAHSENCVLDRVRLEIEGEQHREGA